MISRISRRTSSKQSAYSVFSRPWAADPDVLRQRVQAAISSLSDDQRASYNERLIRRLIELGLNVSAVLFLSGVVEQEPGELTPAEIGHLFRYLRINVPWILGADTLFTGLYPKEERSRRAA